MSEFLFISRTAYSKKEKSKKPPKPHELAVYAKIFKLDAEALTSDCGLVFEHDAQGLPTVRVHNEHLKLKAVGALLRDIITKAD